MKAANLSNLKIVEYIITGWFRSFIADYGVPLMVLLWTALSFSMPREIPKGVPRRLFSPLPWESTSVGHWSVIKVITVNGEEAIEKYSVKADMSSECRICGRCLRFTSLLPLFLL